MSSNYGLELSVSVVSRGPTCGAYEISGIKWRRNSAVVVAEYPAKRFLYFSKREAIAAYRAGVKSGDIVADSFRWQN
jgi:hypothetical protein